MIFDNNLAACVEVVGALQPHTLFNGIKMCPTASVSDHLVKILKPHPESSDFTVFILNFFPIWVFCL